MSVANDEVASLACQLVDQGPTRIINEVRGINRVTYDITSKPPGTIEWEQDEAVNAGIGDPPLTRPYNLRATIASAARLNYVHAHRLRVHSEDRQRA